MIHYIRNKIKRYKCIKRNHILNGEDRLHLHKIDSKNRCYRYVCKECGMKLTTRFGEYKIR